MTAANGPIGHYVISHTGKRGGPWEGNGLTPHQVTDWTMAARWPCRANADACLEIVRETIPTARVFPVRLVVRDRERERLALALADALLDMYLGEPREAVYGAALVAYRNAVSR